MVLVKGEVISDCHENGDPAERSSASFVTTATDARIIMRTSTPNENHMKGKQWTHTHSRVHRMLQHSSARLQSSSLLDNHRFRRFLFPFSFSSSMVLSSEAELIRGSSGASSQNQKTLTPRFQTQRPGRIKRHYRSHQDAFPSALHEKTLRGEKSPTYQV